MAPQINVSIDSTTERGSGKKFTVYVISVQVQSYTGSVEKRYSEFRKLHSQLNKFYTTPEFPPKKAFGNRNPNFIEKRREDLQKYLKMLALDERTAMATEFIDFLEIPKEVLEMRSATPANEENENEGTSSTASPRSDGKLTHRTTSREDDAAIEPQEHHETASADELKKQCLRAFQTGSDLLQAGDYEKAERHLRHSLKLIDEGAISEENRVMALASCLNYLALACKELKRFDEAEQLCQRAVDLGDSLPQALRVKCLNTLAITYSSQKKTADAQRLYHQILELMNDIPSAKQSPVYAIAEGNLAQNYAEQQDYEKAIHHQRHSHELLLSAKGAEHPKTIESLHQLAVLYGESNDFEEASSLYKELFEHLKTVNEDYKQVVKMMQAFRYVVLNTDKALAKKADKIIASYQL